MGHSEREPTGGASGTSAFKTGTTGAFGAQVSDFLIVPAGEPGLPSVPGAGFSIGKPTGHVDVRLSAGELFGLTKVIAAPKITTLDKRDAKIAQGESIPPDDVASGYTDDLRGRQS